MSIVTTPAVLLRSHHYGETSRILRFLTRERGLLGVMARGVRKKSSRTGSSLELFADGTLTFHHRQSRELQTYRDFDLRRVRTGLGKDPVRLNGAALLAEIVLVHTGEEGSGALFEVFTGALDHIEAVPAPQLPGSVLAGAWSVVALLGYTPDLSGCTQCGGALATEEIGHFDAAAGGVRCQACGSNTALPRLGPVARSQLASLIQGTVPERLRGAAGHLRLLASFVEMHLQINRPLRTLPLLAQPFESHDA